MPIRRRKSKNKKTVRSSIRTAIIFLLILIICIALIKLASNIFLTNVKEREEVFYKGTGKFQQNYKVIMKENKYMEPKEIKPDQPYITDLIEGLKVNFDYTYRGKTAEKIDMKYSIKGILTSDYSSEGKEEEIWNKETVLLEPKEKSSDNGAVHINENVDIDIQSYNNLVKDFSNELGIAVASNLKVIFEADITAYVDGELVQDNYKNEMEVTVGDKVTKITGKFLDDTETSKTKTVEFIEDINSTENIILATIIIVSLFILIEFRLNTKTENKLINLFKVELNQILSSCSDKIIKVDTKNNIVEEEVIKVKDINELVKLAEEAYKPILYYQVPEEDEAWFYISLENEIYRFILV